LLVERAGKTREMLVELQPGVWWKVGHGSAQRSSQAVFE